MLVGPRRGLLRSAPVVAASATFVAGAAVSPQDNNFSAGTITFSNLNGGVNFPSGALAIIGVVQDQDATSLSSPTLGGVSATLITGASSTNTKCVMYYAELPSGGADTFTFTNGNAVDRVGVASCYLTGVTATPTDSDLLEYGSGGSPLTPGAVTVPSSGFGVVFMGAYNASLNAANTVTWTNCVNADGDVNSGPTSEVQVSLAYTATSGSWTPTCVGDSIGLGFISGLSVAAWGP